MKYEPVMPGMECDLSETTLEEAAPMLGPSFEYELRVHESELPRARRLLRTMSADLRFHPFAPFINLAYDASYRRGEWSIHANGRGFGSRGVT